MKQHFILLGILAIGFANAQNNPEYDGRIGINTNTPKASLDITRHTDIPAQSPQGLILPHLTTEQRNAFTQSKLTNGLMIYNTTKNCIDWWNGIQWACTDGTQVEVLPVNTTPDPSIKAQVWDRTHYIASFNHNGFNADGTLENSGENLLTLQIPYNEATLSGNYNEINVVRRVKDRNGATKTITLHIPAGSFTTAKGLLTATIKIGNGNTDTYKVKQLTANTEEEITNFTFSINGRISTVRLIASGGLLDRNWDVQTDGAYKHKFVYMPISVPAIESRIPITGQPYEHTWLNNNLGVEYAKVGSASFNPTKQATAYNDHLAYGSLYQWQRPSDGHELITWTSATEGTLTPTTTTLSNNANWTAGHSNFILNPLSNWSWVNNTINQDTSKHNLWQVNGANNPCPVGYHVPTKAEWDELHTTLGGSNGSAHWANSALKLPAVGWRYNIYYNNLINQSSHGHYWSSEANSSSISWRFYFYSGGNSSSGSYTSTNNNYRAYGFSVRCLKD